MKDLSNPVPIRVGAESSGQRVDNFLMRVMRAVPRSHIYRILRTGEVRVNGGRVDATCRLQEGDRVRIPPVRAAQRQPFAVPKNMGPEIPVVYEDDELIVIDKPSGIAVHGGSGISFGIIERIRAERPAAKLLELVHRLDRDTSGLLMLAKKRSALVRLHAMLREGEVEKRYLVLVHGRWDEDVRSVHAPLKKQVTSAGERRVSVDQEGRHSVTEFRVERRIGDFTLLSARLETGRTHQIRVHLQHIGYPIAGDDKYGDFGFNRELARRGLKRLFLHAAELQLRHPATGTKIALRAPLPPELEGFLAGLEHQGRS